MTRRPPYNRVDGCVDAYVDDVFSTPIQRNAAAAAAKAAATHNTFAIFFRDQRQKLLPLIFCKSHATVIHACML